MNARQSIDAFLQSDSFAVVGASTSRAKYGNRVLRCLLDDGRDVMPVNPNASEVEGLPSYPNLTSIHPTPEAICLITQPAVTDRVVREAVELGIEHLWLQPGAENESAIEFCENAGCNLIHSGPCILLVIGIHGH